MEPTVPCEDREESAESMAELRSTNPVFTNRAFRQQAPTPDELQRMYDGGDRLTVDDVVVHTGGLLALLGVMAAIGWAISPSGRVSPVAIAALFVAFALSLVIVFTRMVRPALVVAYTAAEGLFLGGLSHAFETFRSGIVAQALLGTGAIFVVMLLLHTSGRLRATPRMTRVVIGASFGIVALFLVDLVVNALGGSVGILDGNGPLAIIISLAILVIGALQFTLDFTFVEQAVSQGAPSREAWRLSYGLVVSFVWVYITLLRLLNQLRR